MVSIDTLDLMFYSLMIALSKNILPKLLVIQEAFVCNGFAP